MPYRSSLTKYSGVFHGGIRWLTSRFRPTSFLMILAAALARNPRAKRYVKAILEAKRAEMCARRDALLQSS